MTIVILLIIFGYAGFVIYRKVKDMKNGKFCSCGCSSCPSSSRCKDTELKK
ncbi:MAG TPA: FeoB-associated Cys-rich membrane protein [Lachnospiraceae bacterium]|nr:FeoB-associated Cys-rich membrane protein [Lachnospiraceae bacterium]